ncbi:MAG: hypothetical protein ACRC7O_04210 [Fimbriiglobus sp.]
MDVEGFDGKQLGERMNIDPSTVSRTLARLELDGESQQKVDAGEVDATVAIKTGRHRRRRRGRTRSDPVRRPRRGVAVIARVLAWAHFAEPARSRPLPGF